MPSIKQAISSHQFIVAVWMFVLAFAGIVLMSQIQTYVYYDFELLINVKSLKAVLCLSALFYLSFLTKSYLSQLLKWTKLKWHTPAILVLHTLEAVLYTYVDSPHYWRLLSAVVLVLSAIITLHFVINTVKRIKKLWSVNILVCSALIFSCIYAFSLNVNFYHIEEFNFFVVVLLTIAASVLIMSTLLLLSHPQSRQREMYAGPLVIAIVALFEIFGREGFIIWWGGVALHGFLFYLLLITVYRLNQTVARIMNMYQQGLNTNATPYFCGNLDGRILFANQAYRELVGVQTEQNTSKIPHVLLDHPLWPEIKERFCTSGKYQAETVINPVGCSPLSVSIHVKPLHPETDWYQVSLTDLKSRIEIQQKRDIALEKLEQLSKDLMEKQEEERRYFAKELHDEIGQGLTLLKIQHQLPEPDIELINHVLSELLDSVRNLSLNLRPSILDDMGISAALSWLAERQEKFSQLKVNAIIAPDVPRMNEKLEISLFRIAQEAFTNIHKYAKASTVRLELLYDKDVIELKIIDDGIGFDVGAKLNYAIKSQSLGLVSIKERAFTINGELTIDSTPETGTAICLKVPSWSEQ